MTANVPQFPGKPAQTGPAPAFAWELQMCPELTAAEIQSTAIAAALSALRASVLTGAGASAMQKRPPLEAVRCQGPKCGYFVQIGTKGDGGCSRALAVTTMHSQNLLLEAIARKLGAIDPLPTITT